MAPGDRVVPPVRSVAGSGAGSDPFLLVLEIMLENQRSAFERIEDRLKVVAEVAQVQERHAAGIAGLTRWQKGIQSDMEDLEAKLSKRDEKREQDAVDLETERRTEARQLAREARMWRRVQAPTLVIAAAGLASGLVTVFT